jgi:hypothetical protein
MEIHANERDERYRASGVGGSGPRLTEHGRSRGPLTAWSRSPCSSA